MIAYPIGTSGQTLILTQPVLGRFSKYRQRRWWQREAGGQLFARFEGDHIVVAEATPPGHHDIRSRFGFRPDRRREQTEILERHACGLHFIGDWHTHPEAAPHPSAMDTERMHDLLTRSKHQLNGFVMVIVGTGDAPEGLYVALFSRASSIRLNPAPIRDAQGKSSIQVRPNMGDSAII
ncbi:Mov34/MPN/PAD-1 family protein [Methylocella sp.]|uniref:Mov34/MPN/PAD-1 family protein n=1 Tax=Methylocella sp. TaxID=1978226 RepID=UPI003784C6C2